MVETTSINISPIRPFDEAAALDWLRAQPGGRTTLKAADLGRRWGWGRHRPGRRIEAWIKAGKVTRRGNTIAIADDAAGPAPPPSGTGANGAPVPHGEKPAPPTGGEGVTNPNLVTPSVTPPTEHHSRRVTVATLMAALALATVSAGFSITGMTSIFVGAFLPVMAMGAVLEAGKLRAVALLGMGRGSRRLRAALVVMVGILMGLNAVGAYGYLAKAHIEHAVAGEVTTLARNTDVEARLGVQAGVVADLDRRIGQIDGAIEKATISGRTTSAMKLAEEQRRNRTDLVAQRTNEAKSLAGLKVEKAHVEGERAKVEADLGPVRYLATLLGSTDEQTMRWFILVIALLLDPAAVLLLLAAASR